MAALAGECQQVFMAAIFTLYASKAAQRVAAIQIPVNDVFQIGSPEAVLPGEMIIIDLEKGLEMVLHTAVIIRTLRVSWATNSGR